MITLAGDVNDDDVMGVKFVCGAECSNDAGPGWK
jgi:hypothetical protein